MPFTAQPFASLIVGNLRDVQMGPDVRAYLERIDTTLAPFGGRFVIHGGDPRPVEGSVDHDLVVIGFPDPGAARAWYDSEGYQDLVPLRQGFSTGTVTVYRGEDDDHRATDILDR